MNRKGGTGTKGTREHVERDHELRASLFGIEALAVAFNEQGQCVPSGGLDQLALAIASEARRLRQMLGPRETQRTAFDLAEAIRPAILVTRSWGVVVHDEAPNEMWVQGCRDDAAEVVFALLDNARVHAAHSAVDVRATVSQGTTTLYVEDRGRGITGVDCRSMFKRGHRGPHSSGSGLGLSIARRLMVAQGGSLSAGPRPGGGASFALCFPNSSSGSSERTSRVGFQPEVDR